MGEIDTKPIEPVQVALTLFGEKSDQKKHRHGGSGDEIDKEKDREELQKDLANYKVQLETKDAAHSQLLHKLENCQKTAEELSNQLKNSEMESDVYFKGYREATNRIDELEAKLKDMNDQMLENGKIRQQLSHVLCELKAVQAELLSNETELAAAHEAKLKALTQAELMETAANMEKERAEQLLKNVIDLNEAIFLSKLTAKEKDSEIEFGAETEKMTKKLEMMQELENQLRAKTVLIDSLQVELNQANELLSSSDKIVSDVMNDMDKLKSDLKGKEKENSDQAFRISELETEMKHLKFELKNANDEVSRLNCEIEMVTDELEKVKTEMEEIKEKENKAQIEIKMLKAELHKGRAKQAAAEAKDTVSELAENRGNITISTQEYESLIRKAEKGNRSPTKDYNKQEVEMMKKELEAATAKVAEFRTRAEQATTRAEAAERAKLSLEEQLRKWREQKQRRKAALAALREESLSREFGSSSSSAYDSTPRNYQPLGKVLNMKF